MKIYCLSGVGADRRVFQYLQLKEHQLIHIEWIEPEKYETLKHYALRIKDLIDTDEPFAFIGLSFGGMVATEIAKRIRPEKLFVISSIVTRDELPAHYKLSRGRRFSKMLPDRFLKRPNFLVNYLFGVESEQDKQLLKEILHDTDPAFLKWALEAIVNWDNEEPVDCIRIHGTRDRILPAGSFGITHCIKDGGHMMIANKADQVSELIKRYI